MRSETITLLTDDQISRFITDGFLILTPDVPEKTHQEIDERLLWLLHKEGNPGNNVLPSVPEMHNVLDCGVVRGALASVLGPDYVLHPHRFVHNNEPGKIVDGVATVGDGSRSFVGWHQDDHSPLSRPRHHYPRYAMILYYPQDTPVERGPTQLIPGTQLNRSFKELDTCRGVQAAGSAGTCVLVHFDLVHGGSLNVSDRTRNMAKFVFARCSEPLEPTWNCQRPVWTSPGEHLAPVDNPIVWRHMWDWMSGRTHSNEIAGPNVYALIDTLRCDEPARQTAIYELADCGERAARALCERLENSPDAWNEGAVVMDDAAYALAAIGAPGVSALMRQIASPSAWVRVNAAFALGEMGREAACAMIPIISLIGDNSHAVVRTALDAIGQIRIGSRSALPEIKRLLTAMPETFPADWTVKQRRNWAALSQVRVNAVMALLRMGAEADGAEEWLGECLNDECGYVGGFGIEYLIRCGTRAAKDTALEYLYRHRWDNSLRQGMRTF